MDDFAPRCARYAAAMEPLRVALTIPSMAGYGSGVALGVAAYARPRLPWVFSLVGQTADDIAALAAWRPNGVIAHLMSRAAFDSVRSLGVPLVNVGVPLDLPELPHVGNDDRAVAQTAIAHLIGRGLRSLATVGLERPGHLARRWDELDRRCRAAGIEPARFPDPRMPPGPGADRERMIAWLRTLPRPVGIAAINDRRALEVVEACREAGLRVPEDAAVLGVDDDETTCLLAWPPLSSVRLSTGRIGHSAAELLDRAMRGHHIPAGTVLRHGPVGVVARRSTDLVAVEEPSVAQALRLIERAGSRALSAGELALQLGVPRRTLEKRFLRHLGRSPLAEIQRVRVDAVKRMLIDGDMTISEIARRAGFRSAKHCSAAFRQAVGSSPRAWRAMQRPAAR